MAAYRSPPDFAEQEVESKRTGSWTQSLQAWADQQLGMGNSGILDEATPLFERTLIDIALKHTGGRRRDAANLLGWGRNTLTRKIKELGTPYGKSSELSEEQYRQRLPQTKKTGRCPVFLLRRFADESGLRRSVNLLPV